MSILSWSLNRLLYKRFLWLSVIEINLPESSSSNKSPASRLNTYQALFSSICSEIFSFDLKLFAHHSGVDFSFIYYPNCSWSSMWFRFLWVHQFLYRETCAFIQSRRLCDIYIKYIIQGTADSRIINGRSEHFLRNSETNCVTNELRRLSSVHLIILILKIMSKTSVSGSTSTNRYLIVFCDIY